MQLPQTRWRGSLVSKHFDTNKGRQFAKAEYLEDIIAWLLRFLTKLLFMSL